MEESKIIAYFKYELTADEVAQVEQWYNQSEENKQLARQLYHLILLDNNQQSYEKIQVDKAWKSFCKTRQKRRIQLFWKKAIWPAAAFLTGLIFCAGLSYLTMSAPETYAVSTNSGQRAQFILPDGTRVWLNAASQLTYESSFWKKERKATLAGEAYFDVTHNPHSPFTVEANGVRTEVLGTKFNIRARENEPHVITTLLQGAIRVISEHTEEITLKPGECLNINTHQHTANLTRPEKAKDILMWINGKATFNNATFQEIGKCLEKIYNINILFENPDLAQERFTCTLDLDDRIDQVFDILELTRHFNYEINGNTIHIKSKS